MKLDEDILYSNFYSFPIDDSVECMTSYLVHQETLQFTFKNNNYEKLSIYSPTKRESCE